MREDRLQTNLRAEDHGEDTEAEETDEEDEEDSVEHREVDLCLESEQRQCERDDGGYADRQQHFLRFVRTKKRTSLLILFTMKFSIILAWKLLQEAKIPTKSKKQNRTLNTSMGV